MVNQRELTEEGLEKNFATNTLGTLNYIAFFFLNKCMYLHCHQKQFEWPLHNHTMCVKAKNKCHKLVVIFRHLHPHHGINTCVKEG